MEPQVRQTIGIIGPDGSLTTSDINAPATSTTGNLQPGNFVMDHVYGATASPAASLNNLILQTPLTPSFISMRGRSRTWNEFSVTADGKKVTCRHCFENLSYSNSHSTSSMLKHLKRKHNLDLYPSKNANGDDGESSNPAPLLPHAGDTRLKTSTSSKTRPGSSKSAKKHSPKLVDEAENSIQHSPLFFKDPCVRMRWTDHSDTFVRSFSVLYSDENYTDVTVVAEKHFFKAHRLILSSASEFFDEIFKSTPSGQHPIIFLKDTKAMDFRILLDFIYKGEVSIPTSLIQSLVKIGRELRVRGLSDFVWNEQLASSVGQPREQPQAKQPFIQQNSTGMIATNTILSSSAPVRLPNAPIRTLVRQPQQLQSVVAQNQQQPTRMYSRIVNIRPANGSTATAAGIVSAGGNQARIISGGSASSTVTSVFPSMKRIRIVTNELNESRLPPQTSNVANSSKPSIGDEEMSLVEQGTNITEGPETVLMVTNEGETMLSTTQGGVTVLTQPSTAMAIPLDHQEMQTDQDGNTEMQRSVVEQQLHPVITAISSQAHLHQELVSSQDSGAITDQQELDEVVYSIAEISDEGNRGSEDDQVLMHKEQDEEAGGIGEPIDKKPFL